jgi:hypothetical protein
MTMQDNETKAGIFPGEVIIVAGGKIAAEGLIACLPELLK